MISKIKRYVMIAVLGATLLTPVAIGQSVSAQNVNIKDNICGGGNVTAPGTAGRCESSGTAGTSVQKLASDIINLLSWVVGVISVIMIIVAGFRYITSGGASEKVTGAKNTLIYAVIGLVIVALAQFIVRFVLSQASEIG